MSNYRSDMLARLIQTLDRRSNQEEAFFDENTIRDVFFPISERVDVSDTVEILTFTGPFVWGDGSTVTSNWLWSMGGRWS